MTQVVFTWQIKNAPIENHDTLCARVQQHAYVWSGHEGGWEIMVPAESEEASIGSDKIDQVAKIFIQPDCKFYGFEEENFGGRNVTFSGYTDGIEDEKEEILKETDAIDTLLSYKCTCGTYNELNKFLI